MKKNNLKETASGSVIPVPSERTLAEAGLTEAEAAELRWRFQAFCEDWERPEMDVYND